MRTDSLLVTGLCALALAVPMAWAQQVTADVRGKPLHSAYSVQQTPSSEPHWKDLSTAEQKALKPLASHWDAMGLNQKRKWQSVAKDFDKLPAAQQSKLHNRMTEWVTLSPQQRNVARQNFAQHRELTDGLTPEQRKAQWQAYQALSADEKRQLAQGSGKASLSGAALAPRPQPVLRKESAPEFGTGKILSKAQSAPPAPAAGKKIAVAPHIAHQGAILPGTSPEITKP